MPHIILSLLVYEIVQHESHFAQMFVCVLSVCYVVPDALIVLNIVLFLSVPARPHHGNCHKNSTLMEVHLSLHFYFYFSKSAPFLSIRSGDSYEDEC